jgi:hypothetical protein
MGMKPRTEKEVKRQEQEQQKHKEKLKKEREKTRLKKVISVTDLFIPDPDPALEKFQSCIK